MTEHAQEAGMTSAASQPTAPPSALAGQLRWLAALAAAAAIFWTIGWMALQPLDPAGPVTLLGVQNRFATLAILTVLAMVSAVLAVVIAAPATRYVAPLAVAVGLAVLNWRGASSELIGGYLSGPADGPVRWPAFGLTFELWLWLGLVAVGLLIGTWCADRKPAPLPEGSQRPAGAGADYAAVVVSAVLAYLLMLLMGGEAHDPVLKQQVYFAVGMGFFLSSVAARMMFRPASGWWPLAAVGVLATTVYMTGSPFVGSERATFVAMRTLRNIPTRPLPIEYAALGALGGYLGILWLANMSSASPTAFANSAVAASTTAASSAARRGS